MARYGSGTVQYCSNGEMGWSAVIGCFFVKKNKVNITEETPIEPPRFRRLVEKFIKLGFSALHGMLLWWLLSSENEIEQHP